MLCCWEKSVEKKTITKPLLAESKSSASAGEPKPEPQPEPKPEPKPEPVVVKSNPEPVTLPPKPTGPKPEAVPISIPQKSERVREEEPATFVEKNDFIPKEKKNRSKSNKR